MILTLTGAGIGLGTAFSLTRVLSSFLFGVTASDPFTFGFAPLLAIVAMIATYLPARRATQVDPIAALRHE